jgi:hypothetical protein
VFAYEVEITADRDDVTDTMKGVITYTVKGSEGGQLRVTYQGGTTRKKQQKAGQSSAGARPPFGPRFGRSSFGRGPGGPRGPRGPFAGTSFKGLTTTTNEITLKSQGEIQSLTGDSQLPYLLGNLSIMVFEPLPEAYQTSWAVNSGVTITEENERRTGPPFFARPPFDRDDPSKQTGASETTSFTIESDDGNLVSTNKRYQLTSPSTDGESFQISGSGKWVFNRSLAVSESLDFKQNLTVHDGNKTITVPMTIKYRRLSEAELAKHQEEKQKQREEQKQRLAEMQRKRGDKSLSDTDRQKILDDLKSGTTSRILRALQQLQRKSPTKSDPQIAAAVRALASHQNRLIQQLAQKVEAKLSDADMGASQTAAPEDTIPGAASGSGGLRTWTDNTGSFKIEAAFLGIADGAVRLRRQDGREISVPLARLSRGDQKVAEELGKKAEASSNPFEP